MKNDEKWDGELSHLSVFGWAVVFVSSAWNVQSFNFNPPHHPIFLTLACERIAIKTRGIKSRFAMGPEDTLFAGTFQPGNSTVKRLIRSGQSTVTVSHLRAKVASPSHRAYASLIHRAALPATRRQGTLQGGIELEEVRGRKLETRGSWPWVKLHSGPLPTRKRERLLAAAFAVS